MKNGYKDLFDQLAVGGNQEIAERTARTLETIGAEKQREHTYLADLGQESAAEIAARINDARNPPVAEATVQGNTITLTGDDFSFISGIELETIRGWNVLPVEGKFSEVRVFVAQQYNTYGPIEITQYVPGATYLPGHPKSGYVRSFPASGQGSAEPVCEVVFQ